MNDNISEVWVGINEASRTWVLLKTPYEIG